MENINLFNLLEKQDELQGVGSLAPELSPLIKVFAQDISELTKKTEAMIERLGEQIRVVTENVLNGLGEKTKESVTHAVDVIEGKASVHFSQLNKFYILLMQLDSLLLHDGLRVPNNYSAVSKVVCGTSAIKTAIKNAKNFIEIDLLELKKELV